MDESLVSEIVNIKNKTEAESKVVAEKKKRGRPPKAQTTVDNAPAEPVAKKRGRPKKNTVSQVDENGALCSAILEDESKASYRQELKEIQKSASQNKKLVKYSANTDGRTPTLTKEEEAEYKAKNDFYTLVYKELHWKTSEDEAYKEDPDPYVVNNLNYIKRIRGLGTETLVTWEGMLRALKYVTVILDMRVNEENIRDLILKYYREANHYKNLTF